MTNTSVQPRDLIFVKGFLSFTINLGRNTGKNLSKNLYVVDIVKNFFNTLKNLLQTH